MTTYPPLPVTPRDLFLARELSDSHARAYLAERGFREPVAADEHLQQLADDLPTRLALGELAEVLLDTLIDAADPDAALVGFCRYVTTRIPKSSFLGYLHDDPRSLQILTRLLGASPFLSEILIRNPEYLHWLQRQLDRPPRTWSTTTPSWRPCSHTTATPRGISTPSSGSNVVRCCVLPVVT